MFANPIATFSSSDVEYTDQLLAHDSDSIRSVKKTAISGAGVLLRGTVVGVITSGGKVQTSLSGASDGSQTPYGIVAQDVDATSADAPVLIYVAGSFNAHKLILGASHTVASIYEGLRGKGIFLELNPVIAPAS